MIARITGGLVIGLFFAVGSYIFGAVITPMYVCCFESNVFFGLMFIGPLLALAGGLFGLLLGSSLGDLRHFGTMWRQSCRFKITLFSMIGLALVWLAIVMSIITE